MKPNPTQVLLELDLSKPKDCRTFIEHFQRHLFGESIQYVDLMGGRRIYLSQMSDEDAVTVANEFHWMAEQARFQKQGIH